MTDPRPTRLSLLKPTGGLTLGNYLGALRPMAADQHDRCFYGLADLHALTVPHDPATLRRTARETAGLLVACGLEASTLFRQSRVPAHAQLAFLLECTAHVGELGRMIQYKEKGRGVPSTRVSLLTYPVLAASPVDTQLLQLTGDLSDELIRVAEETGAELLVIGLRRRSPIGKLIMGSVAQRVLLDAPCPVLAVKG